jgi:hypothetical protein
MAVPKPNVPSGIRVPRPNRIMQALTAPPPHLDVRGREVDFANKMIASDSPQLDPDVPEMNPEVDLVDAYDEAKAINRAEFDRAAATTQPDQRLPAFTGMSNIDFHPMHYTGTDNQLDTGASVGRTTLFDSLRDFNNPERAEEIARNMTDRNRGNRGVLMPSIHPRGGVEHFGRDILIARTNTSELGNGTFYPGYDVTEVNKLDDDPSTINHENNGHARTHWSPYRDALLGSDGGGMSDDPRAWLRHANRDIGKFAGVNKQILDSAKRTGQLDQLDFMTMNVPFLGPTGGMELMHNAGTRYSYRPQEVSANGAVWKDQSLQRNGFRTLAEVGDEEAYLNHALYQPVLTSNPAGVPAHFRYQDYNKLLLDRRAFHEALTRKGKQGHIKSLVNAGAVAAPIMAAGQGEDQ